MHTSHLLSCTLLLALLVASACSRAETQQEAREVASDARAAAARAGDQLADSWLTTKIQAQYFADEDIKARQINVSTRDGVVVLTGSVEDPRARAQAVQIARNTDGVRQVEDRLTVEHAPGEIASTEPPLGATEAQPASEESSVTTGAVPTTGSTAASPMPPVIAVDDRAIATRIQSKFFLDDSIKARHIDVATQNGIVTLRGTVASEAERAQALLLARTTEGVQRVEDSLSVEASLAPPAVPAPAEGSGVITPAIEPHDAPPEG